MPRIWRASRWMLVCGEPSGDALGAQLMAALKALAPGRIQFSGVGGPAMAKEGLQSLYPLDATAWCRRSRAFCGM
jgi:lipid-A-disaccharide synthase